MPSKPKATKASLTGDRNGTTPTTETISTIPPVDFFPFAQYASVVGVHLLLVGFTALYLPQTTRLFGPLATRTTDRPQSEFMEALTADPVVTLGWICGGLVMLQVWWASWVRQWYFEQTAKGTKDEVKLDRVRFNGLRFTRLREASLFTLCTALAAFVVIVLFGAPLASHHLHTALLALVVAVMTSFTPAFAIGSPSLASETGAMVNRLTWTRLFAELSPRNPIERSMVYPAVGVVAGSWLGAIPIALDWDRPWQAWPLTPLFGSLLGYIVGATLAFGFSAVKWLAEEHIRSLSSKSKSS
ncbi:hypothetical protein HYDPIDRAFT_28092 [Hydnomerulius pinastri MD-312]|uniref:Glycosylphosphatidylinositol anchor biosynthesis protein 11 n=1 Tax=Hydnomerulius pinastri MD-312 TaxID=994086 RepID=A0A0C9W1H4_9AGAM|nr:hypothetical protein HYDPIDRAFT_28092 [Hydnomerulius pinastri MD-312]